MNKTHTRKDAAGRTTVNAPTPETDAIWFKKHTRNTFIIGKEVYDFACKLERERDEAEQDAVKFSSEIGALIIECNQLRAELGEAKRLLEDKDSAVLNGPFGGEWISPMQAVILRQEMQRLQKKGKGD